MFSKNKTYPYLITFITVTLLLLSLLALLHTYPFGDKMFLWADSDQYLSYYSYLSTILDGNNIYYSLNGLFGSNEFPSLAYYAFSPFNILFIVFPNHLIAVAHFVVYLKIILSALSFTFFLSQLENQKFLISKVLLSVSYAFMGYTMFYGWNASWLDAVVILPIIVAGIRKSVLEQKYYLYIFSLTYGIVSQYYIGFMLGIASILFFVFYVLTHFIPQISSLKDFLIKTKTSILKYLFYTIISVGISAVVLLPAFLGIPNFRKTSSLSKFIDMEFTRSPIDILSGIFSGQQNTLYDNSPLLYVGILPIILVILYFLNSEIPSIEKICFSILVFIFIFSFMNSFINLFWHGLSINSWFNYRYSFLMSFLLLYIAFESIRNIHFIDSSNILIKALCVFIVLSLIVISFSPSKNKGILFSWDIISTSFIILILLRQNSYIKRKNIGLYCVIAIQVIISLLLNSFYIVHNQTQMELSRYNDGNTMFSSIRDYMQQKNSPYRVDMSNAVSRANAQLFNYHGITNYSSAENKHVVDFSKNLGMISDWMQAGYNINMPFSAESIVGLKYILTDAKHSKPYKEIRKIDSQYALYENTYALPIIFEQNLTQDVANNNPFITINNIYKSLDSDSESIFTENTYAISDIKSISENNITLYKATIDIEVNNSGSLYIFVPKKSSSISILPDDKKIETYSLEQTYYIGQYKTGDKIQITVTSDNNELLKKEFTSYTENSKAAISVLSNINHQMKFTENSSSDFEIEYSGTSPYLSMTIPFESSWRITDNGKEIQPVKNWNVFMSIPLNRSVTTHHIRMKYIPRGLTTGVIICAINLVGLVAAIIHSQRKRKTPRNI